MNEEQLIADVIKSIKLPAEVTSVDYAFADDSTGVPAVWVNLHVAADSAPTEAKVRELSKLRKAVSRLLLDNNVSRWPYVQLVAD